MPETRHNQRTRHRCGHRGAVIHRLFVTLLRSYSHRSVRLCRAARASAGNRIGDGIAWRDGHRSCDGAPSREAGACAGGGARRGPSEGYRRADGDGGLSSDIFGARGCSDEIRGRRSIHGRVVERAGRILPIPPPGGDADRLIHPVKCIAGKRLRAEVVGIVHETVIAAREYQPLAVVFIRAILRRVYPRLGRLINRRGEVDRVVVDINVLDDVRLVGGTVCRAVLLL